MIIKDNSVKIHGIRPELVFALNVANDIYAKHGQELVITSLNDGKHSSTSLHYSGCAADLRINYFNKTLAKTVRLDIDKRLGIDYDVILESDHIHIEYQPRKR